MSMKSPEGVTSMFSIGEGNADFLIPTSYSGVAAFLVPKST